MAKPPTRKPAATTKKKAAAPARKTATAKVSPLRGTSVDDYVARLPSWQGAIAGDFCALVRRVAPAASVSIKWAQPVFEQEGPFAYIKPASKHVSVGFW